MTAHDKPDDRIYTWNIEEPRITIHIRRDVIRCIHSDAAAEVSSQRRGAETGGLLLGAADQQDSGLEISIEGYEPFYSEHRFGPSYVLSETDKVRFEAVLCSHKEGGGPRVVGFYRSHTRDGLELASEDLELIQACFPASTNAFLLMKPRLHRTSEAAFFFRNDKAAATENPFYEFPFQVSQGGQPPAEPLEEHPDPPVPMSFRQVGLGVLTGIGVLAIVAAATALWSPSRIQSRAVAPLGPAVQQAVPNSAFEQRPTLGLTLAVSGSALWLRWRGEAVQNADRAVLLIQDGDAQRKIELDRKQLERGSVLYLPSGGDVVFEMQTITQGPNALSESIRYLAAARPRPAVDVSHAPVSRSKSSKPVVAREAPPSSKETRTEAVETPARAKSLATAIAESGPVPRLDPEDFPSTELDLDTEPAESQAITPPRRGPGVKGRLRNFGAKVRKLWPFGQSEQQQQPAGHH